MASLYLHIPFCRRICGYCDFFRSAKLEKMDEVIDSMIFELEQERDFLSNNNLSTIYFGGGTPSLLKTEQVAKFMERIDSLYDTSNVTEITFESNPDDLNLEYLTQLRDCGINRLSIGVQSFNDEALKFMNRRHTADQARRVIEDARSVGFDNIAIDLIFGIDGFGGTILQYSLDEAISLDVEHIAAYHLTIEPGTLFARKVQRGEFAAVAEEVSETEFEMVHNSLVNAGYEHYEISNYSRQDRRSQHNSAYWSGSEYLGVGPGAHSYASGVRRWANDSLDEYLNGKRYGSEQITKEEHRNEIIMTSLRRCEGLNLAQFEVEYGSDGVNELIADGERSIKSGDLVVTDGWLHIPAERFLRSDMVIEQLFRV